jgi:hypothetical protein
MAGRRDDLKEFRKSGVVTGYKVIGREDCPVWVKRYKEKKFPLSKDLKLPIKECPHRSGCACCLLAILDV